MGGRSLNKRNKENPMNNFDNTYQELLERIMKDGTSKSGRTNTCTRSEEEVVWN